MQVHDLPFAPSAGENNRPPIERAAGYEVYGREGQALSEKWRPGISTMFGMQTRGFPNCFIVSMAQTGGSANFPHLLDVQSRHAAYIIQHAREHEAQSVDVSEEAEAGWVQSVIDTSASTLGFQERCTPGYYNNEGQPNGELIRRNGSYAPGIIHFSRILDEWRAEGNLAGLEFGR